MFKLATVIFTAAVSTTFAAGALASDIEMNVVEHGSEASVLVTRDGQPVADKTIQVSGLDQDTYKTSTGGAVIVRNDTHQLRKATFTVTADDGESLTTQTWLARPQN